MKIQFFGATKLVTGSCYLITTNSYKLLLDCGMFQGHEELEQLNYSDFPFNPKDIDFLVLSHAHIDHSGRIPKLVKDGFKGKIITTKATYDLCKIMLLDSGHIHESDADWENRKRIRSGKGQIEPLYTSEDANQSLRFFENYLYGQKIQIREDLVIRFKDAGHVLGSSIVELWITENKNTIKIVFSGDLGMKNKPILRDPELVDDADYLILESTYGNRCHETPEKRVQKLTDIINKTVERGGTVIIPSFAVGKTQELIYELNEYYEYNQDIETFMRIPVYIDSPMAISATRVFLDHAYSFNEKTKQQILNGDNPFEFENLNYVKNQDESIRLNNYTFPKVIISSSGMCTAGRVRHHLKHNLWKKENSVVFVGYQAEGTTGRLIKDGLKTVNILGEEVVVEAEVHNIEGFSGHADQNGLMDWLGSFKNLPKKVFLVHGEEDSSKGLADSIKRNLNIDTIIPSMGDAFDSKDDVFDRSTTDFFDSLYRKENIKRELQQVYNQFERIASRTDKLIDNKFLKKDYDALNNKLLELQQKLMDINIMLSE